GQEKLAELVFPSLLSKSADQKLIPSGASPVPNACFTRWANGGVGAPLWWVVEGGATAQRSASLYETQLQVALVMGAPGGAAVNGKMSINADELLSRFNRQRRLVIAARVWSEGSGTYPGVVQLSKSVSSSPVWVNSPI